MILLNELAASALASVLKQGPRSSAKVQFAWRAAVGPALERVTRVTLDPAGTLLVRVADERWQPEIGRSRETILSRMVALLGEDAVKKITIRRI